MMCVARGILDFMFILDELLKWAAWVPLLGESVFVIYNHVRINRTLIIYLFEHISDLDLL